MNEVVQRTAERIAAAGFPYWTAGDVLLVNGDCLAVLPLIEAGIVDAVVTDPPYEGMKGGTVIRGTGGVAPRIEESLTIGDELGTAEALRYAESIATRGAIAFCSYHWIERCLELLGGKRRALLSWYKRNSPFSTNNSPWFVTEYAWAVQYGTGIDWRKMRTHIDFPMLAAGCMAGERLTVDGGKSVHPAQKPVDVMLAVLCPGMDSVLDPYAGLFTTGVACVRTGRAFIGIEIEPRYYEIGIKRINDEFDRVRLFEPAPPVQRSLI